MGHIYFIMGIAGSGKSTLIGHLKDLQHPKLHIPISYKTRPKRENEVNGKDAWFISREDFFSQVQAGEFLEYAIVHETDYYGTKFCDVIENGIEKGYIVIKELDINGLEELKRNRPEFDSSYSTIFLHIPENMLKQRIEQRGVFMSDEELFRRLSSAVVEERKCREICTHIIDATQTPQEVLQDVLKIINL